VKSDVPDEDIVVLCKQSSMSMSIDVTSFIAQDILADNQRFFFTSKAFRHHRSNLPRRLSRMSEKTSLAMNTHPSRHIIISYSDKTNALVSNERGQDKKDQTKEKQHTKNGMSAGDKRDLQTLVIDTLDE
jgi:hypothetical protein